MLLRKREFFPFFSSSCNEAMSVGLSTHLPVTDCSIRNGMANVSHTSWAVRFLLFRFVYSFVSVSVYMRPIRTNKEVLPEKNKKIYGSSQEL